MFAFVCAIVVVVEFLVCFQLFFVVLVVLLQILFISGLKLVIEIHSVVSGHLDITVGLGWLFLSALLQLCYKSLELIIRSILNWMLFLFGGCVLIQVY